MSRRLKRARAAIVALIIMPVLAMLGVAFAQSSQAMSTQDGAVVSVGKCAGQNFPAVLVSATISKEYLDKSPSIVAQVGGLPPQTQRPDANGRTDFTFTPAAAGTYKATVTLYYLQGGVPAPQPLDVTPAGGVKVEACSTNPNRPQITTRWLLPAGATEQSAPDAKYPQTYLSLAAFNTALVDGYNPNTCGREVQVDGDYYDDVIVHTPRGDMTAKEYTDRLIAGGVLTRGADGPVYVPGSVVKPFPKTAKCVTPQAPTVSVQATACVQHGATNGVVTGVVNNPNGKDDTALITVGGKSVTVSVPAKGSANFSVSGFAPGSYSVKVTLKALNTSASASVKVEECKVVYKPVVASNNVCGFVSFTNPNDQPAVVLYGKPNATEPDATLTLKPGETVKVGTQRTQIVWAALVNDQPAGSGEVTVKQNCAAVTHKVEYRSTCSGVEKRTVTVTTVNGKTTTVYGAWMFERKLTTQEQAALKCGVVPVTTVKCDTSHGYYVDSHGVCRPVVSTVPPHTGDSVSSGSSSDVLRTASGGVALASALGGLVLYRRRRQQGTSI